MLQLQGGLWGGDEGAAVDVVVDVDARFDAVVSIFETCSVNTCIVGKDYEFWDTKKWYCNSLFNLVCSLLQCYSVAFHMIDVALLCFLVLGIC